LEQEFCENFPVTGAITAEEIQAELLECSRSVVDCKSGLTLKMRMKIEGLRDWKEFIHEWNWEPCKFLRDALQNCSLVNKNCYSVRAAVIVRPDDRDVHTTCYSLRIVSGILPDQGKGLTKLSKQTEARNSLNTLWWKRPAILAKYERRFDVLQRNLSQYPPANMESGEFGQRDVSPSRSAIQPSRPAGTRRNRHVSIHPPTNGSENESFDYCRCVPEFQNSLELLDHCNRDHSNQHWCYVNSAEVCTNDPRVNINLTSSSGRKPYTTHLCQKSTPCEFESEDRHCVKGQKEKIRPNCECQHGQRECYKLLEWNGVINEMELERLHRWHVADVCEVKSPSACPYYFTLEPYDRHAPRFGSFFPCAAFSYRKGSQSQMRYEAGRVCRVLQWVLFPLWLLLILLDGLIVVIAQQFTLKRCIDYDVFAQMDKQFGGQAQLDDDDWDLFEDLDDDFDEAVDSDL
jgi:hypothetical protein